MKKKYLTGKLSLKIKDLSPLNSFAQNRVNGGMMGTDEAGGCITNSEPCPTDTQECPTRGDFTCFSGCEYPTMGCTNDCTNDGCNPGPTDQCCTQYATGCATGEPDFGC